MKKIIFLSVLCLILLGTQAFASHRPHMSRPYMYGVHMSHMHRPPIYHNYARYYRPYHYSFYYSVPRYTTYTYYTYEPVVESVPVSAAQTVVVKENNYVGVNTAANVINAAANVAATVKYLSR